MPYTPKEIMTLECEVPGCTTPVFIESKDIIGLAPNGQYITVYFEGSALLVSTAKPAAQAAIAREVKQTK